VTGAGVLVDVDDTLVDSNYHHTIAWARALRDHGCNARLAAIHRLIGMGGSQLLETLIGRSDDAIEKSWRAHFDELLPEVYPFDGAVAVYRDPTELLDRLDSSPLGLLARDGAGERHRR
jgi:beta-phosphoglucomutase-like phosphatase (HAD superfamily)